MNGNNMVSKEYKELVDKIVEMKMRHPLSEDDKLELQKLQQLINTKDWRGNKRKVINQGRSQKQVESNYKMALISLIGLAICLLYIVITSYF